MSTTTAASMRAGCAPVSLYDPTTAQFLTPDPLVTLTSERYGYAGNDPLNGGDPSGLCGSFADCAEDLAVPVSSYACHRFGTNKHKDASGNWNCDDDGTVNAVRHFVGSALLTWIAVTEYGSAIGSAKTWAILAGHEVQGACVYAGGEYKRPPYENGVAYTLDTTADDQNNFIGFSVGLSLAHMNLSITEVVARLTGLAHHYVDRRERLNFHGGGYA